MSFNPHHYPICLTYPKRIASSTWLTHVPFGMLLVDALRPKVIVELGTFFGVSYCAFCQAVKELHIGARCYAVDTWEGDNHGGFYGPAVFADLQKYHDPMYSSFSVLIKSAFTAALNQFENSTIDLSHIDGLHTYEAVKEDFRASLPKMSSKGIMLFHDTQVKDGDFGVWKFWEEISSRHPHFEMVHGYGLGILAVGERYPNSIRELFESSEEDSMRIKDFFNKLGMQVEQFYRDADIILIQERRIKELEKTVAQFTDHPIFRFYHSLKYLGKK